MRRGLRLLLVTSVALSLLLAFLRQPALSLLISAGNSAALPGRQQLSWGQCLLYILSFWANGYQGYFRGLGRMQRRLLRHPAPDHTPGGVHLPVPRQLGAAVGGPGHGAGLGGDDRFPDLPEPPSDGPGHGPPVRIGKKPLTRAGRSGIVKLIKGSNLRISAFAVSSVRCGSTRRREEMVRLLLQTGSAIKVFFSFSDEGKAAEPGKNKSVNKEEKPMKA